MALNAFVINKNGTDDVSVLLKKLKKKLERNNFFEEYDRKLYYMKPSEKKKIKKK